MISRNEKGKIQIDILGLEIFCDDFLRHCKNKYELTYLVETICEMVEKVEADIIDERGWGGDDIL